MQEMNVLDKGIGRETSKKAANCENEALKMKLLEALHTAPQKMQTIGSPIHEEKAKNKQNCRYQRGEVARHKKNSGPTQTDLESPNQTKSRPVIDSLIRKKAPTKTKTKLQHQVNDGKKPIPASISDCEQKFREKNMFAFDHGGGKEGNIEWAVGGHSSRSNSKGSAKQVSIEPRRIYFPRQAGSDMDLPANEWEQILPSPKKAPLQRKKKDDSRETNESQDRDTEKHFPQSPMEEQDTKSSQEDGFISKGFVKPNKWLSDVGSSKKSSSTLRHNKRVRIQEDLKASKINLSSLSPTGTSRTEETVGSREASEPHLTRTFSQMASVLEGFNTKLKSHTSKRSSEILSSALDKIRLQLQVVESQMQADVGKLTNVGKSKRKRLESTFQEQHQKLRLLHDKFKEEVNQKLLDCRTTLEELGAYQLELKGTAERQKASHRKLLVQTEEAMKVQLSDADTRISAVNKEARHKMSGLKQVLEEWMAEGEEIC